MLGINISSSGGIWFDPLVNVSGYPTHYNHTIHSNCNLYPFGLHGYLEGGLFTFVDPNDVTEFDRHGTVGKKIAT